MAVNSRAEEEGVVANFPSKTEEEAVILLEAAAVGYYGLICCLCFLQVCRTAARAGP